ncbi:MAG: DUF484 family protein [Halieaceae bacterium]
MPGTNEQAVTPDLELDDEQVREYLKENSDFLQRNPDMLDFLHVSHASGSAVSLVEKQVSVLRERNIDMRHRLNTLTANARDNDKLYEQTRNLVLRLLEANTVAELHAAFHESMSGEFEVEHATMILFGEPGSEGDCRVESADSARIEIGPLLKGKKAMCGPLRKEELGYLFPGAGDVGSAAVMPLHSTEDLGVIAVGSSDASRYSSNMGTLFLNHIADVIIRLLPYLPRNSTG